jgi:hypothetical protein
MATKYIAKFESTSQFLAHAPDNGAAAGIGEVDGVLYANIGGEARQLETVPSGADYAAVTQITSAATGVEVNAKAGAITTVALTTAAAAEEAFEVTNSEVVATDVIALSTTYAGAGTPMLSVKGVGAGVFTIVITNVHAANALDALMVINFRVLKAAE